MSTARRGGMVTVSYVRLRRSELDNVSLYRYDEIHDLRVPPGTRNGDTLRVPRMGDAGAGGGPFGDLVCDIGGIADDQPAASGTRDDAHRRAPPPDPNPPPRRPAQEEGRRPATDPPEGHKKGSKPKEQEPTKGTYKWKDVAPPVPGEPYVVPLPISVSEALLGARVEVETPGGRIRLVIPSGTSTGRVFRIRGKGPTGLDGAPMDIMFCAQVMVPPQLDAKSRELVEEFARLNPFDPRSE